MTRPPDVAAPGAVGTAAGRGAQGTDDDGRIAPAAGVAHLGDALERKREADHKKRETLAALLALKGFQLHVTDAGIFIRRWGLDRRCESWDDAEQFARQVGAQG